MIKYRTSPVTWEQAAPPPDMTPTENKTVPAPPIGGETVVYTGSAVTTFGYFGERIKDTVEAIKQVW